MCERESGESDCVCVSERVERVIVCVCERESGESDVCVCERERVERVIVCVCV